MAAVSAEGVARVRGSREIACCRNRAGFGLRGIKMRARFVRRRTGIVYGGVGVLEQRQAGAAQSR
jgi:hypothetical protein